ncbi:hypothetical protein D3C80_2073280 [compost metagenome]
MKLLLRRLNIFLRRQDHRVLFDRLVQQRLQGHHLGIRGHLQGIFRVDLAVEGEVERAG